MDPHEHAEHMVHLDRMLADQRVLHAELQQINARLTPPEEPRGDNSALPPPLDPEQYKTTIAQARRMAERETHPTWFQAAYADLAQRLARVEDRLEHLEDSLSLLHSKMEMIIGQLAAAERPANGRDA